jgi:pimeloyl-ACP methyl ester carboxylesterase
MFGDSLVVLPGLGGSTAEWACAIDALGGRREVHAALPASGSAVVIGHSLGAVEALTVAVWDPDRVDAVVLTASFFPPARAGRTLTTTIIDYGRHRALYVRDLARARRAPHPTPRGARELASLARLGIRPGSFHALAARVRCPVLVIHGDADHVVPVAFARAATARYPAWTYHEIHGAGHFPHRDRFDDWADIVGAWLERP